MKRAWIAIGIAFGAYLLGLDPQWAMFIMLDTDVNVPGPTAEEQEIQRLQLSQLRTMASEYEALKPLILREYGIREVTSENPRAAEIRAEIARLQASTPSLPDRNMPGYRMVSGEIASVKNRINELNKELQALQPLRSYEEIPEGELPESQREERQIQREYRQRQLLALEGKLPISPALTESLNQRQAEISESLARCGALPGSTPYAQTQGIFTRERGLLEEEARRGQIGQGEALLASRAGLLSNVGPSAAAPYLSVPQARIPTIGTAGGLLQPYQFQRQMQFQGDLMSIQMRNQLLSDLAELGGTAAMAYALA